MLSSWYCDFYVVLMMDEVVGLMKIVLVVVMMDKVVMLVIIVV